MNTTEVKTLESYFKTENEHWNGYTLEIICEVFKQGNFKSPETPVSLFSKAIDVFMEQYQTPLQAIQNFNKEIDNENLNPTQKLFVLQKVLYYINYSAFDNMDMNEISNLLKSQTENLKAEVNKQPEYKKPLTGNIRDTLKDLMQKELEQLPETLKELDNIQRINILCKLMPYVLPKTESVKHNFGEPDEFKIKKWHD